MWTADSWRWSLAVFSTPSSSHGLVRWVMWVLHLLSIFLSLYHSLFLVLPEDPCELNCEPVTNPRRRVCGTDGITYTSYCLLKAARCTNSKINFVSRGECPEPPTPAGGFISTLSYFKYVPPPLLPSTTNPSLSTPHQTLLVVIQII